MLYGTTAIALESDNSSFILFTLSVHYTKTNANTGNTERMGEFSRYTSRLVYASERSLRYLAPVPAPAFAEALAEALTDAPAELPLLAAFTPATPPP